MLRTIFFYLCLFVWFVFCSPILLIGLVSKKLERFFVVMDAYGVLLVARYIGGIKYNMHYQPITENGIPFIHNINTRSDKRAIIASKHMSVLEVAILCTHIPNCFFILKRELLWIPIYGWAFKRIGMIGVNRNKGKTNLTTLADMVTKNIMNGLNLIIFPEGTRTLPGNNVPLRRGLLFLAEHLKLPILPVSVDTGLYWPKKGKIQPGTANIYFEQELSSNASLIEVYEAINKHSC